MSARASLTPAARAHVAASFRVQAFQLSDPRFTPNGTSSGYDGLTFDAPPTAVTGDVAASFGVGPHDTRLRVHVGNAYRAPSLYERFGGGFSANPATGLVSFTAYGDPRLEPDRYVSADAGVEQTFGRGRLRATWFHAWIDQLTEFDFSGAMSPATDPYGRFGGYINGGGGRSRGVELEADIRLASLTVTSAYTFTDSITDRALLAADFFRAPSVARHTVAVTAVGHVGEHLELVGDVFARSPIYTALFTTLGSRAYEFPGRATVDVGAAWSWRLSDRRRLRAHAKIDNLFDRRYYELGWLAPGATVTAGVTLQYLIMKGRRAEGQDRSAEAQERRSAEVLKRGAARFALLGLLFLTACRSEDPSRSATGAPAQGKPQPASASAFPRTVVDGAGRSITLPSPPRRIVSQTLATDEVLFSIVDPARIVGVSTLARDPAYSNVVKQATALGAPAITSAEQVLTLRPDLVFVATFSRSEIVAVLAQSGAPVYRFARVRSPGRCEGQHSPARRGGGRRRGSGAAHCDNGPASRGGGGAPCACIRARTAHPLLGTVGLHRGRRDDVRRHRPRRGRRQHRRG